MVASRWKASAVHLLISIAIAALVLACLRFVLFPGPFFDNGTALQLFVLLTSIDVVLGPVITAIIYDVKKKGLKFDIACIGIVQLAALAYGLHSILGARPVYVVYVKDHFESVAFNELPGEALAKVRKELRPSFTGPRFVAIDLPKDPALRKVVGSRAVSEVPEYYVDYERFRELAASEAKPFEQLLQANPNKQTDIQETLISLKREKQHVGYVPLVGPLRDMAVLIDRETGDVLEILDARPRPHARS